MHVIMFQTLCEVSSIFRSQDTGETLAFGMPNLAANQVEYRPSIGSYPFFTGSYVEDAENPLNTPPPSFKYSVPKPSLKSVKPNPASY